MRESNPKTVKFVCDYWPFKSDQSRISLVVGRDKLDNALDDGSSIASMQENKLLVISVISDEKEGDQFISCDMKDLYICTTMDTSEYMWIPYKYFPKDIQIQFNLKEKVSRGFIFVKIKRGMYGLKQAAIIANEQLVKHLKDHGFYPVIGTNAIFTHKTQRRNLCLCVDYFGIKYHWTDDVYHILISLKENHVITTDWEGKNFCG